jgi:predicted Rossmann fold flavoprotein
MHAVAVVGGGAAGFFAAISAKEHVPDGHVVLLEKSQAVLSKVRVSGGGRCNVTHDLSEPRRLAKHYPRGGAFMRQALQQFGIVETVAWFQRAGVALKTEADGRMFPTTNDSGTIVDALTGAAKHLGVEVRSGSKATAVRQQDGHFELETSGGMVLARRLVIATGGSPKVQGLQWLQELGHHIVPPVPSLFTFDLPNDPVTALMGISVPHVRLRLPAQGIEREGPLLITHWGFSGPAVLWCSAWCARELHAANYTHPVHVNWCGTRSEEATALDMQQCRATAPDKSLGERPICGLPKRLWAHLVTKAGFSPRKPWRELGSAQEHKLIAVLTNDTYFVRGKTTFKEEFVTAGGIQLDQVSPLTLESKVVAGMHFAGEVLDIDGVTGGFNFQAAWTTGWLAGRAAALGG